MICRRRERCIWRALAPLHGTRPSCDCGVGRPPSGAGAARRPESCSTLSHTTVPPPHTSHKHATHTQDNNKNKT